MGNKKFWISTAVVFVTVMALGMFFHGFILHGDYGLLPNLFRNDADFKQNFPFLLLGHLIMSGGLVWFYGQGKESKPFLGQGLRFGLGVALAFTIPCYLISYAVQPLPGILVAKQMTVDTLSVLATGVVLAWMEK